jgi:hypothetical protein
VAARSANVPEPTKLVPGERGVLDRDNASGYNNQAISFSCALHSTEPFLYEYVSYILIKLLLEIAFH